jgi:hypothetical protein
MNLHDLIEQYIVFQQLLGLTFRSTARTLRAFTRAIGPKVDIIDVRPKKSKTCEVTLESESVIAHPVC